MDCVSAIKIYYYYHYYYYYHISPILKELNWLQVPQRCQYKILVLTFKVLHYEAPAYIANLLTGIHCKNTTVRVYNIASSQ